VHTNDPVRRKNRSIWLDIMIVAETVKSVVRQDGAR
jgi:hypothetical protein